MVRKTIKTAPYTFLPSLRPTEKAWATLTSSLCSLFQHNRPVKWRKVYHGSSAKLLTSAPTYPLFTSQYFVRFQDHQLTADARREEPPEPSFEFLGSTKPNVSQHPTSFTTNVASLSKYIKAHIVGGIPLCPASILMEIALEALSTARGTLESGLHVIEDITFDKPLVYAEHMDSELSLRTDLDMQNDERARFSCSSHDQFHCGGRITRKSLSHAVDIFARKEAYVKRQRRTLHYDPSIVFDSFSPKTIYEVIFPRVVAYGSPFLTLKKLAISESRLEGCGTFQLDASTLQGKFVCPPPFVDTLLHAAGFIANSYVPSDIACICASIERAMLPTAKELGEGVMTIYCNLTDVGHSVIADSYVIDSGEKVLAFIEGICFKKIPLKSFHSHLSRLVGKPTQTPPPLKVQTLTIQKSALHQPESQIEDTIQNIIRESCGVSLNTTGNTTLSEAGVDSLMLIEIVQSIRNQLPHLEIDESSLERCTSLQELVATVSKVRSQEAYPKIQTPELTPDNSPRTPAASFSLSPSSNSSGAVSPIETLLFETCGIQISEGMKNLALSTLGVDSLLSIEIVDELQGRFGLAIDDSKENISDLTFYRLEALFAEKFHTPNSSPKSSSSQSCVDEELTESSSAPEADESYSKIIQRQNHGMPKCNVYLFHDGSGHCTMYSHMIDINHTISGIYSPDPLSRTPKIERLEDLANLYIRRTNLINDQEVVLGGKLTY